jgi:beta-glucanase (GH16 family)
LTRAPDGRPLVLTFGDEFDRAGRTPGPRWRTTFGDGQDPGIDQRTIASNKELQLYVDRDYGARIGVTDFDPFDLRDGVLHIAASRAPAGQSPKLAGRQYRSGLISSLPSAAQRYGYFEVRAKLPRGKGLWPAIWLLPADLTWPPEIDIMESIGDPHRVYVTVHSKAVQSNSVPVDVPGDGFHTYAVSWDPRAIVWYLDGAETARQPTPADMDKPMYLIANLAVGGQWPGAPDASTTFPAELQIDYVRIYRFADGGA